MTAALSALSGLLAATSSSSSKSSGSSATILIVYGAIAVAFYFFFWRPRQKRAQAARAEQASGYEVGDEVLTAGGIVGHIIDIQGDRYTLETSVGASFVVLKQYVLRKLTPVEPETDEDEDGYHEPPAPEALEAGETEADEEAGADEGGEHEDGEGGDDEPTGGATGGEGEPGTTGGTAPTGGSKAGKRRGRGRKDDPDPDGTDGPSLI